MDTLLLNAGAALLISKKAKDFKDGINLARELLKSKKVLKKFEEFKQFTKEF